MRTEGYYWVKFNNEWIIAQWIIAIPDNGSQHKEWFVDGVFHTDSDLDEIDENRIVRPIENTGDISGSMYD